MVDVQAVSHRLMACLLQALLQLCLIADQDQVEIGPVLEGVQCCRDDRIDTLVTTHRIQSDRYIRTHLGQVQEVREATIDR